MTDVNGNRQARLKEKVAIVTGAGRGIGEAIALRFAAEGARLVLVARTASNLEETADKIRVRGGTALPVAADVTHRGNVTALVENCVQTFGRIDILVNAAGTYGPIGKLWELDAQEWMAAFSTNLFSTFSLCQAVLPHMVSSRSGKIINFSGGGATSPLPRFTAYGVSKTAVVRLTETLAEEVREYNIQVNAIAPGAVDTQLQDQVLNAGEKAGELFHRIKRLRDTGEGSTPREVPAELAVFLASDDSDSLTGRLISAPFDGWQSWDAERLAQIMSQPWFTLRRMDPFTIRPLLDEMKAGGGSPINKQ